jgi:hypothetical protein
MQPLSIADFAADPEAALLRVRGQGALVPTDFGWMVIEHDALRAVLSDERLEPNFSALLEQFGITSGPFYDWMSMSPLDMDGEEHRRWRKLMQKTFTPRSVERLRPFLRTKSHELIDAFAAEGRCEFVDAFARKLPSFGLCELIGVPKQDRADFCSWADTIGLGFNMMVAPQRIADIDAAISKLLSYASELIEQRRREPKDDLVSRLAQAAHDEGGMNETLMRGSIAGLVFAGHETTKNQLGWMIAVLAQVPDEWARVHANPDHARDVVEEVLRFRSAATNVQRTARVDVEIGGCPIAKGTRVIGNLWAANRDPAAFPNPDVFSAEQHRDCPQIAFGYGAHHCLGAALARAELDEALIALASRIECPAVEPGAEWLPPVGINGPLTLPIRFSSRR